MIKKLLPLSGMMAAPLLATLLAPLAVPSAALAAPASAEAPAAAGPVSLTGDVKLDKTVTENGQTRHVLVTPDKVVPGDRLVFTTAYRNTGSKPIERFVVTNPVPPAVAVSAQGADAFEISADGGNAWGRLGTLRIADGKGGSRLAEAADVTHLRWTIPVIAPGGAGVLEYHAVVR